MSALPKLRQTRQGILTQIALIEEMRRGSVIRQFLKIRLKGQSKPILAGPYALLTLKQKGRTVSRRLRDLDEILKGPVDSPSTTTTSPNPRPYRPDPPENG